MKQKDYTGANRKAWNQAAPHHAHLNMEKLLKDFSQPDYSCLDKTITPILKDIGLSGKAVAQLCCNNGRETISLKNMGASRAVGFDIAGEFLKQGEQLREKNGLSAQVCQFVETDIYKIPESYNATFDLIYISIGVLAWMPDIENFFAVVRRLLKPESWLVIYEMHPMLDMFEAFDKNDPPALYYSYFHNEPYVNEEGLDYYSMESYESAPSYDFHHKMSDIITGILKPGMILRSFQEYEHDLSNLFAHFENLKIKPALSYSLTAQVPAKQ